MSRVAAIGLDAAEWWWVERLMDDGSMPNIAKLREQSVMVPLQNVTAYRAERAWTDFVTGRDARTNDYWGTTLFDPATYTASMRGAHDGPAFWSGTGLRSVIFDVPHSVLREDVDGIQVTAWGAHSPQYPRASFPQGTLRAIDERFGPHPAFDADSDLGWNDPDYIARLTEALVVGAQRRADAALWLLEHNPDWQLFVTVMSETHSAPHHLWHGADTRHPLAGTRASGVAREGMQRVAAALDAAVGRIVENLPDDAVVTLFSMHGMEASHDLPSLVLVPELLHRLTFGKPFLEDVHQERWVADGMPAVDPEHRYPWAIMGTLYDRRVDRPLVERVMSLLPVGAHRALRRLARRPEYPALGERDHVILSESTLPPDRLLTEGLDLPFDWAPPVWYAQNWHRMPAFVLPSFSGDAHLRINVTGRERDGVVDASDFRRVGQRVIDEIAACTDPRSGLSIVESVEWLRGNPDDTGPDADLIVRFAAPVDAVTHPKVGLIGPLPHMRAGTHTSNGFALISGPGIEPKNLSQHPAADLPPTLLDLLSVRPADDLAGSSFAAEIVGPVKA